MPASSRRSHVPAVLSAFFGALFLLFSAVPLPAGEFAGLLYGFKGSVLFQGGEASAKWVKAKRGMGLLAKDRLKAEAGGEARIFLDDGSFYNLKSGCEVEIAELQRDRKSGSQQSEFLVKKGTMLGRVEKLKGGSSARFRSPTALVAVRGTELAMDVAESGDTRIALFEGRIIVNDFVKESGLPGEQGELLLEFLHEVALKPNTAALATKKGIKQVKQDKEMEGWRGELASLKKENDTAQQEQSALSYEQSQKARAGAREEALKSAE